MFGVPSAAALQAKILGSASGRSHPLRACCSSPAVPSPKTSMVAPFVMCSAPRRASVTDSTYKTRFTNRCGRFPGILLIELPPALGVDRRHDGILEDHIQQVEIPIRHKEEGGVLSDLDARRRDTGVIRVQPGFQSRVGGCEYAFVVVVKTIGGRVPWQGATITL